MEVFFPVSDTITAISAERTLPEARRRTPSRPCLPPTKPQVTAPLDGGASRPWRYVGRWRL